MDLHTRPDGVDDIAAFERDSLARLGGMPREVAMRHRLPHFDHLFGNDMYSAGYYSYLWSDVLTADAAEAFEEAPGGFYDQGVAQKLRNSIFSVGNTIDPAEGYRQFRGRDPKIDALMRKRGFPVPRAVMPKK
jgi:peptidyl-dipeptidase Dcp